MIVTLLAIKAFAQQAGSNDATFSSGIQPIRRDAALAPLEPASGILLGAWIDTNPGMDTPLKFNARVGFNASFFLLGEDFPLDFNKPPPSELIDQTNTNAIYYLTVYPTKLTGVTDNDINELVKQVAGYTNRGKQVFLRFAPEMNGNWFVYGQKPTEFKNLWIKVVQAMRANPLTDKKVAFVWGPNFGFGYPYPGGTYAINSTSPDFSLVDTNRDGRLDAADDPYSPYYPGDQYVDWVGLSVYWFGSQFPWVNNVLPVPTAFDDIITGKTGGGFNFYETYSARAGKPFIISETGVGFHVYLLQGNTSISAGPGELQIKQAFWRQYITDPVGMQRKYPKIKAVCLFEWQKPEEQTFRNFQITNNTAILNAFVADLNPVKSNFLLAGAAGNQIIPPGKNSSVKISFLSIVFSLFLGLYLVI